MKQTSKSSKSKSKSKSATGRRRNAAPAGTSAPVAPRKTNAARAPKANGKPRGSKPGTTLHNPPLFKRQIGGLSVTRLLAAAGGAVVSQTVANALPIGAPNSWLQIGEQLGIAVLINKLWPRALDKEAATLGAAVAPAVGIVNKLWPNIQGQLRNLIPFGGAQQPAEGVSGLVAFDENSAIYMPNAYPASMNPGMAGLVGVPADSPVNVPNYYY